MQNLPCTDTLHSLVKSDINLFRLMPLVGFQETYDDEGQPPFLEMRNCKCGSTLCFPVFSTITR